MRSTRDLMSPISLPPIIHIALQFLWFYAPRQTLIYAYTWHDVKVRLIFLKYKKSLQVSAKRYLQVSNTDFHKCQT